VAAQGFYSLLEVWPGYGSPQPPKATPNGSRTGMAVSWPAVSASAKEICNKGVDRGRGGV